MASIPLSLKPLADRSQTVRAGPWSKAPISHLSGVFDRWSSLALTYGTGSSAQIFESQKVLWSIWRVDFHRSSQCFYRRAAELLQGAHITRPILSAAIIANIVNLILDALVLLGPSYAFQPGGSPRTGIWSLVLGLAVVSSIASFVQLLVMYGPIKRHFQSRAFHHSTRTQRLIFRIGFPLSIQLLAEIGVFSTVLILISRIDAASTAAHQVALSIASLTFAVCLGIGAATSVAVGRAVGAGERRTMVESGFAGILLGIGFMSVTACLMWLFPRAVSSTITSEASVLSLASQLIIIAGFFQIVDGIQAVAAGALRGLGLTRFSSIANLLGHWAFGLPLGLWLAFEQGYGVVGLWWGLTSSLIGLRSPGFVQVSRRDIASFRCKRSASSRGWREP